MTANPILGTVRYLDGKDFRLLVMLGEVCVERAILKQHRTLFPSYIITLHRLADRK
jgi:hypothetical protein